jgi:adenine/guanine phosphoribosyltransferase-like PRPP-binding protein
MVDDLLATGGTMEGSSRLIEQEGGIIVGYAFVIELVDLNGLQIKKLSILKPLVDKSVN